MTVFFSFFSYFVRDIIETQFNLFFSCSSSPSIFLTAAFVTAPTTTKINISRQNKFMHSITFKLACVNNECCGCASAHWGGERDMGVCERALCANVPRNILMHITKHKSVCWPTGAGSARARWPCVSNMH